MNDSACPVSFHPRTTTDEFGFAISSTVEVDALLAANACVAIGVSGGKDSSAVALRVFAHLDSIGHTGPRVLIHSDLGRVEWKQSLAVCERLAQRLGCELMVVRRAAGDMLARWQGRWQNNVKRYADLSCVKLILPWSTPSMRFCTSELKVDVICRALTKRFPDAPILSVTGIRRAESASRAKMPVTKVQPKLARKRAVGLNWNAIMDWTTREVLAYLEREREPLHEGYTTYGMTRISCAFCILSTGGDLRSAANCADNADVYRAMVDLEAMSTYAFQGARWLADVAPELLSADVRLRVVAAKAAARAREAVEARLPKHLLYTAGWPTTMPTRAEAELIAEVRREVAKLVGLTVACTDADSVLARYAELMALARNKVAAASDPILEDAEMEA